MSIVERNKEKHEEKIPQEKGSHVHLGRRRSL